MSHRGRQTWSRVFARRTLESCALAAAVLASTRLQAQTVLSNTAAATYETIAGRDSVGSNTVETTLVFPDLFVEKALSGPSLARIGEEVRYTIRYSNASGAAIARNVELIDTLPVGLEFVSSQPTAQVAGQILTWNLGDMAPGDSSSVMLTARVSEQVRDTVYVRNMALLLALNSRTEAAVAAGVQLVGVFSTQLSLEKSADVLEVGIGETAPYTLVLENTGSAPISDLRVHDRLPEGARYARGSVLGADSVQVDGRRLTLFIAGPLAPRARHTVRYAVAVVSAESDVIGNTAYATAEGEFVRSEDVVAWLRVRRSWPMETRAAIGKVWVDLDGDGGQDAGEPGVEGVDVWTDDGEVASTDTEGKFSFRNLRPGRHVFRLDRSTVPAAYGLPRQGPTEDLVAFDADGWTTPRINFQLVPRGGRVTQVHLPVPWRFTARPLGGSRLETMQRVEDERPIPVVQNPLALARRPAQTLTERPECSVEVAGYADPRPIRGDRFRDNWQLPASRADSAAQLVSALGVPEPRLTVRGSGATQPVPAGTDPLLLRLKRRAEGRLICPKPNTLVAERPVVEYEVLISNGYGVPLSGLAVRFEPAVDSAVVMRGDSAAVAATGRRIALPPIPAHSHVTVRAWAVPAADTVMAVLEGADPSPARLVAQIHNPLLPVQGVARTRSVVDTLPSPQEVPPGATIEVVIEPSPAGWPEVTYPLPSGWEFVPRSVRVGDVPAPDPDIQRDRTGAPVLYWRFPDRLMEPISLHLQPADAVAPAMPVRIPTLRSEDERAAERQRAFIAGPGVAIFDPADGTVYSSDRVYIGVRGEPGTPVALFDGDSLLAEANLRIDGIHDFIAVDLSRGPHRLRVRMTNSWQQERWDSVAVHVTGRPTAFVAERERIRLVADGQSKETIRVRVFDRWGVPVVNNAYVTISAEGATPVSVDADPSSVGLQLRSDRAGWLTITLKPGRAVGSGSLMLRAGEATQRLDVEVMPAIRPLMVTGIGRIGLGGSPASFGAITARGRLDDRTSVVLGYDSRRLDAGRNFFGRASDPLEEAQYPILGDASQVRTVSASRNAFSARVERGFDWLAFGDISTVDFASDLNLTAYQRALSGGAARITTGPVTWRGFGSLTSQSVAQAQLRGGGISGPYQLQRNILPGSEQVAVETRARENAQRIISRQALVRFIDYQIDYERGTLIFKRPVPATDTYENPVFIVVTYEAESGGEQRVVGGLRASVNARGLLGSDLLDSLRIGVTGIHAGEPTGAHYLAGADMRLLHLGALDVGAEVSYSQTPDSSGFASAIDGAVHLFNSAINLTGGWMNVGSGFGNPANTGLRGGTEELRVGGGFRVGASELRIQHEWQSFGAQDIQRQRTSAGVVQSLGSNLEIDVDHTTDRFESGSATDRSQAGEVRLTWTPTSALKLWSEGRHQFSYSGNLVRPDHVGAGAAFRVGPGLFLEARHRQVLQPGDASNYSITDLGLRTDLGFGTHAWGSYQIAGGVEGTYNAAVVGLNNHVRLGSALTINTLFERRVGLSSAPITNPVRAAPFLRAEEDYWSAGMGIELLPQDAPYRMSARGEYRDGDVTATRLVTLAGDVTISRAFAVLSRQEYLRTEQRLAGSAGGSRRLSSLWGMAFRPIKNDALNVLTKFSWLGETNPVGGVLTQQGDERRIIGAAELIWAPFPSSEIAGRYAIRHTQAHRLLEDGLKQSLASRADYVGARISQDVSPWLAVRGAGRLLIERTSDTRRWDAAPSLAVRVIEGLELESGYRFGDLRDPDFAVRGGHGWFVTVSAYITERVFPTAAEFWHPRFARRAGW